MATRQQPAVFFFADDKFFDVIRGLEARGWTRHAHVSFPKCRLKWTNYSKIPWSVESARRKPSSGAAHWLNHFQHAVLFSQKDVFARALYELERTAASASTTDADAGVDGFYLRTFDLLRDEDRELLREWVLYSSALAILKSYAAHPSLHDSSDITSDELASACALLSAAIDVGPAFFSRARGAAIIDADAPEWQSLVRRHRKRDEQAARTPAAHARAAPPDHRHDESKRQVERILDTLRELDVQIDAVGVENQSVWICKPSNLSQGRGIQLLTSLDDILALQTARDDGGHDEELQGNQPRVQQPQKGKWVVQKYMEQPLLSLQHGRKFDIRQWVLVASLEPLRVFWYHKCYLRFCSEPFSLTRERLDDQFVHLSNFSIQKNAAAADNADTADSEHASMWSSDRFQDHLRQQHGCDVWSETIVPQMQRATRSAILSTASKLKTVGNGFEWLGLDFLLDESYRPWLLEVNVSPDVSHSTSVTAELVPRATADLLELILDEPRAPGNGWIPLADFSA